MENFYQNSHQPQNASLIIYGYLTFCNVPIQLAKGNMPMRCIEVQWIPLSTSWVKP